MITFLTPLEVRDPMIKYQPASVTLLSLIHLYLHLFKKHIFLSYFYHSTSDGLFWSKLQDQQNWSEQTFQMF